MKKVKRPAKAPVSAVDEPILGNDRCVAGGAIWFGRGSLEIRLFGTVRNRKFTTALETLHWLLITGAMQSEPIVILGGGVAGLACALALRQIGLDVVVCERAPELSEIGAGLLLSANACSVLQGLGTADDLLERSALTKSWELLSSNGQRLSRIKPARPGELTLSTRRSDVQAALAESLPPDVIRLGHEAESISLENDGVSIRFQNGVVLKTPLLIAADGANSLARRTFWPDRNPVFQGYLGWRAIIDGVPNGWENGRVTESWGNAQRFGIAEIGRGQTYWYATTNHQQPVPPVGDRRLFLQKAFEGWHAPVAELLEATPAESILCHPIADLEPQRHSSVANRVVLLGDAAHPLTPNLGQGAAMALEDAWELAAALAATASVAPALHRFEAARSRRVRKIWAASRFMGRLILLSHPVAVFLRNWMLRLTPEPLASRNMRSLLKFQISSLESEREAA